MTLCIQVDGVHCEPQYRQQLGLLGHAQSVGLPSA